MCDEEERELGRQEVGGCCPQCGSGGGAAVSYPFASSLRQDTAAPSREETNWVYIKPNGEADHARLPKFQDKN
ncbi:hypothetical protein V6N11_057321 [Hibiscus sabdariffa]|uniref:Uncharacterized protein n=2 Tax=Hibiscus sabdariffa TaxID=183260 RepID=A0ABR2N9I8_9ROSI